MVLLGLLVAATMFAQDAAYEPLSAAFNALRARDYDNAIVFFRKAAMLAPGRADIRKNLAYTLLKAGEKANWRLKAGTGEKSTVPPSSFQGTTNVWC